MNCEISTKTLRLEIARIRDVIMPLRREEGVAEDFDLRLMRLDLSAAAKAIASRDLAGIAYSYQILKGWVR